MFNPYFLTLFYYLYYFYLYTYYYHYYPPSFFNDITIPRSPQHKCTPS